MHLAFINSNFRPSFVIGSTVYEVQATGDTAQNMVAIFNAAAKEFCEPEKRALGRVVEALLTADVSVASRHELEALDDDRMKVLNRNPDTIAPKKRVAR